MVVSERRSLYKRKRGLIKKCVEISNKCNQDVYLVIYDKVSKKFIEYISSENFNLDTVYNMKINIDPKKFQQFCNDDYDLL